MALDQLDQTDQTNYIDSGGGAGDYGEGAGGGGGAAAPAPASAPPSAPPAAPPVKLPPGWVLDTPASPNAKPTLDANALAKEPNPIVRMLVSGDYDPMLMRRFKPEEQQALLQRAQQYDPGIDLSNYPAKAQAKKTFTSGQGALAARQINQFIGHVNQLADAESQLNNSNILPGVTNTVGNTVAGWFSGDAQNRQANYDAVAQAVANEYENMLRGSSISGVKEREGTLSELSKNRSPEAVKGWINGALGVMNSRLNELQDQYKQGTGLQYGFDVLNPKSKMILRRFGVQSEGGGTAPAAPTAGAPSSSTGGNYQMEKSDTPDGKELIYYPPGMQPNASLRLPGAPPASADRPKQLDPATAQQFLQQAGGNKDKARMLARAAGYAF